MVAIIDYKAGNLTSVARALDRLGYENQITDEAETILAAERVIFPGVGACKSDYGKLAEPLS